MASERKNRMGHGLELKLFATLTLGALMAMAAGLVLGQPLLAIAGMAVSVFAGFGALFALAKERRWLE